jgi:hypothetical protein
MSQRALRHGGIVAAMDFRPCTRGAVTLAAHPEELAAGKPVIGRPPLQTRSDGRAIREKHAASVTSLCVT